MSRIGKKQIAVPEKVKLSINGNNLSVQGPQGSLSFVLPDLVTIDLDEKVLIVKRSSESQEAKSRHGLIRAILENMVRGVTDGFKRELDITGVGYRAEVKGSDLHLALGFSHPVVYPIPQGVKAIVEKQTHITLTSPDKQLLGKVASEIRSIKPPEPYKAKGVRYSNEQVRRKAGKSAAGGSGGKK